MLNPILLVFMQILLYSVYATSDNTINADDKGKDNDGKLVGGLNAYFGQFPYQVSLRTINSNFHFCGGAIYSRRWIITAAHCLDATPSDNIVVVVGTLERTGVGSRYEVERILQHSGWNEKAVTNDIGLVKTVHPIEFTAYVYPIEINRGYIGEVFATLSGWGRTSEYGPHSTNLKYIQIQTVTNEYCKNRYSGTTFAYKIYDYVLCTHQRIGIGFCNGDSGGPLVANGKLIAIVSWVPGCGEGYPDVYMRVSNFVNWIENFAV